jgi:hypothetical protein
VILEIYDSGRPRLPRITAGATIKAGNLVFVQADDGKADPCDDNATIAKGWALEDAADGEDFEWLPAWPDQLVRMPLLAQDGVDLSTAANRLLAREHFYAIDKNASGVQTVDCGDTGNDLFKVHHWVYDRNRSEQTAIVSVIATASQMLIEV